MNNNFLILKQSKILLKTITIYVDNLPRKEYILKDKIITNCYDIVELVLYVSNIENKKDTQAIIMSKISAMDFYIEICFDKSYISENIFNKITKDLLKLYKMIYGWCYGSKSN